jgi:ABC-type uncharacterized transport system ATPase subunit
MKDSKEIIIKTEGLTKKYGDFIALQNLNLQIFKGEIFGFLGYELGLAICQSIVSLHKGHIDIASNLGKGTTVSIYLPKH